MKWLSDLVVLRGVAAVVLLAAILVVGLIGQRADQCVELLRAALNSVW